MGALCVTLEKGWRKVDVRSQLPRDHAKGGLNFLHNGTYTTTQAAVFCMSGFKDIAKNELMKIITEGLHKNTFGCTAGFHRSDVLTRWLEEALNAFCTSDGTQVFQARAFPMSEAIGYKGCKDMANQAKSWMENKWGWAAKTTPTTRNTLYGYEACGKYEDSSKTFTELWDFVESESVSLLLHSVLEKNGMAEEDEERTDVHQALESEHEAEDEMLESEHEAEDDEEDQHVCDAQEQAYVSTEFDGRNWAFLLDRAGCDSSAKESFFLLAQLPMDEARYHANNICNYLIAKKVQNPNRLVHNWVSDCRRKICVKLDEKFGIQKRERTKSDEDDYNWKNGDDYNEWGNVDPVKRHRRH